MDVPFPLISQVATIRKHQVGFYAINKLNPKSTQKKKKMNLGHASNSTCQKMTTAIRFYWSPDLSLPPPSPCLAYMAAGRLRFTSKSDQGTPLPKSSQRSSFQHKSQSPFKGQLALSLGLSSFFPGDPAT